MTTFQELSLSPATLKAIVGMGFEEATPIQEQAIPAALEGRDVIGQAQTGTGKTAAFAPAIMSAMPFSLPPRRPAIEDRRAHPPSKPRPTELLRLPGCGLLRSNP